MLRALYFTNELINEFFVPTVVASWKSILIQSVYFRINIMKVATTYIRRSVYDVVDDNCACHALHYKYLTCLRQYSTIYTQSSYSIQKYYYYLSNCAH